VDLADVHLRLAEVASLDEPLGMAARAGDDTLYVAEKTGRVIAIRDGAVLPDPVLDLRGEISLGGEQGLLGLAFSPDGRFLYVNYTDVNGSTNVDEFAFRDGRADMGTRRRVLFVEQPFPNHNGGNLVFGPDGYLYIGLGDGGSGGDPYGNAQNLNALLGKMLRIDPRPSGGRPYGIPGGNPFVGRSGARPEIWAYGLRNPWRYSFDRETGDLWIGDVGQNSVEEIDVQRAASDGGQNYGWNRLEGTHRYSGNAPANAVPPVYEFLHDDGVCAVTGGYVYRGEAIPALQGAYLFADSCAGFVHAFRLEGGKAKDVTDLDLPVQSPVSFGEDDAGELYVLSLGGTVYRIVAA
jgi:glucose/arabinose dehydrogenase